jgi:hypothetical protein
VLKSQSVVEDTALGGSADLKQVSVEVPFVVATGIVESDEVLSLLIARAFWLVRVALP